MKVLFVCTGNTCRSPVAEIMFRDYLKKNGVKNVEVSSAGLIGGGKPISKNSELVLKSRGLNAKNFRSTLITKEAYDNADFVFTMTLKHKNELFDSFGKKYSVFAINEVTGGDEIFDPYLMDLPAYEMAAGLIEIALPAILKKIES